MLETNVRLIGIGVSIVLVGCSGAERDESETLSDVGVSAASLSVPEGSLYQIKLVSSGKCAAVQGGSTADGAKIVQQACSASGASDRADLVNLGGDTYQVRPTNSGKCIVAPSATGALIQRHCEGGTNEQFRGTLVSGGIRVQNVSTGKCVTAANSSDGTQFTQVNCSGGNAQTFQLVRAGTVSVGDPIPGIGASNLAAFNAGLEEFEGQEGPADGLGPIFNDTSCANCHNAGATGGGSDRIETRFGRRDSRSGSFDPLASLGGSLRQDQTIGTVVVNGKSCVWALETVPQSANVTAGRRTTPLFGLGLVDAVPDSTYQNLAANQPRSIRGKTSVTTEFVTGRTNAVGKFGWKGQNPTLFQFSGDAYLFEMGITNTLATGIAPFGTEQCPNGAANCSQLNTCDPVPGIDDEDESPADGVSDGVAFFANFMKFLVPPPRGNVGNAENRGESVFSRIGCNGCHTASFTTANSASLPDALRARTFHPYSDFLLHDMDGLGDQIVQGSAGARDMRTAPLWGLRFVRPLLHDGRATTVDAAIRAHRGQGQAAADSFGGLSTSDRSDLLAFLNSL